MCTEIPLNHRIGDSPFSYTLFLVILGSFDFPALQQAHRVLGKASSLSSRSDLISLNRTDLLLGLCLLRLLRLIEHVLGHYQ